MIQDSRKLTQLEVNKVIKLLNTTTLSLREIANVVDHSTDTIRMINKKRRIRNYNGHDFELNRRK